MVDEGSFLSQSISVSKIKEGDGRRRSEWGARGVG